MGEELGVGDRATIGVGSANDGVVLGGDGLEAVSTTERASVVDGVSGWIVSTAFSRSSARMVLESARFIASGTLMTLERCLEGITMPGTMASTVSSSTRRERLSISASRS